MRGIRAGCALAAIAVLLVTAMACGQSVTSQAKNTPVPPYAGGPRMAVETSVIDAGPVAFNQNVNARWVVRNVGDRPLTIAKVDVKTIEGC